METLLIILGAILLIIILAGLLMNKDMTIEKHIVIQKPAQEVFQYIKYIKNQDNFSKWNMTDPTMKKSYSGTDGQVGFIYSWDSTNKNVGAGEQEITRIDEGQAIDFALRFKRPMEQTAQSGMRVTQQADGTHVMWGFYGKSTFPMVLFKSIFQKMLGNDLQTSLNNLKKIVEQG